MLALFLTADVNVQWTYMCIQNITESKARQNKVAQKQ